MLAVKAFLHRVQGLFYHTLFAPYSGHTAPALGFYEYLSLLVFVAAYLVAEVIVGAQVPFAVPAVSFHGFGHILHVACHSVGLRLHCLSVLPGRRSRLFVCGEVAAEFFILAAAEDELSCNHQ